MEGIRIRKLRDERGMSLNKLSGLTGISKSYLSLLERGIQKNPSIVVLEKLAEAFQVSVDVFIRREKAGEAGTTAGLVKLQVEFSEKDMAPEKFKRVKELLEILNEPGAG
ncbi:helix-turn-helix domain-containing protein [Bacillus sp. B-jedd]|uniref:helix-turn-helix domain-containing protein n=1 Tax=Bacillus sp. B-jedd TaxID=1476857 RepID=UPI000515601E|nr:helix-turn-helix transcriptional regulator [Bacillus sp. B-jedd]CEG28314.1 transcriptional regulator [Bacillus sp. B-jedd]